MYTNITHKNEYKHPAQKWIQTFGTKMNTNIWHKNEYINSTNFCGNPQQFYTNATSIPRLNILRTTFSWCIGTIVCFIKRSKMSKLLTFHTLGGVAKRTSGLKLEGEKILRPTITPIYPPKRQRPSLSLQKNSTCRVPASSVSNLSLAIGFFL